MTTKYQSPIGHGEQFTDDNGDPLASGTINTYVAGTTANKATYKDNAGAASHTNPIVLGANGRVPDDALWLDNDQGYKFLLKDSGGSVIYTIDNISAIVPATVAVVSEWITGPTPTFIDTTSFSVTGDHSTTLHAGRRVRVIDSSTLYGFIASVSYSSGTGLTTVTVTIDGLTNLTNNLSSFDYGILSSNISTKFDDVLLIDGRVRGAAGTEANPAYSFAEDTLTGMYRVASAHIGFATASVVRMSIAAQGLQLSTLGVDTEGTNLFLRTKVMDIGDWNMDTTGSVSIAHGLSFQKVRSISVLIRNDLDTEYYDLSANHEPGNSGGPFPLIHANNTNIVLERMPGGFFDDTNYDSTTYNRGWITIIYTS